MPAMRYSLAITAINQMDLEKIQSAATTAFLSATGYNRHMPRAIVFAPKIFQGLGMHHLYGIQGCNSTRLLIQELNMKDSATGNMLRAELETIQMESGIGLAVLEETRSIDYIEWGWIPQIREFLQHINGKITNATPTPKAYQIHDRYIMDSETLHTLSYKERMLIHRCRLYLQVEVLSDISDAAGEHILQPWFGPDEQKPSYSTKSWPQQKNPGKEAWRIWRRFIGRAFLNANGRLRQTLGNWTQQNDCRVHERYCSEDAKILYIHQQHNGGWRVHVRRCAGRRSLIFSTEYTVIDRVPEHLIAIDIKSQTTENITTGGWSPFQKATHKRVVCQCFTEHVNQHQKVLSEHISILVEESEIVATLKNPTRIEVASDGGFDPTSGISTFGWEVAMNRRLIAKGRGPVAAHPDLAESFRAEEYGLASVTGFIKLMINHFNITIEEHTWKFYIDNKAMIQRMESYHTNIRHSRRNL